MLDLESMVKDELETTHGIDDIIEQELASEVESMVQQWINNHDLREQVSDELQGIITKSDIADAIESAIRSFIEDAIS